MDFDFGHMIVTRCDHTRYPNVHINHNGHRDKKGAHRRKHDIAFVLIVPALNQVASTGFVPIWKIQKINIKTRENKNQAQIKLEILRFIVSFGKDFFSQHKSKVWVDLTSFKHILF